MTGVKLAGLYSFGKIAAYLSRTDQTFSEPLEVSARFLAFASRRTQTAVRENARSEAKARPAKGPEKTALLRLAKGPRRFDSLPISCWDISDFTKGESGRGQLTRFRE